MLLYARDSDFVKLERPLGGNKNFVYFSLKNGKMELLTLHPNIKKGLKVTTVVETSDLNYLFGFTFSILQLSDPSFAPHVLGFDPATCKVAVGGFHFGNKYSLIIFTNLTI